jgi:type I restriction-modification system DNA methylase subunit
MARVPGKNRGIEADRGAEPNGNGALEAKLWAAADALRNNMDAAEYKHVVLGLIFLKYISDAFEAKHAELDTQRSQGADPEDPDEYRAQNIFWVPPEARWTYLKSMAPQPTIGQLIDDAMTAIERDNTSLKGVLPKDYARPGLDKTRLGQIINLVSDIALGAAADRAKDKLGQVYEYFLSRFASAEGKSGGQFYTPSHVVRVLVEMLAPYKGRVYDPCCGSGGMFVQSEKFIHAHSNGNGNGGKAKPDISIWGQESNYTTWRLAKMNLAIRGIDARKLGTLMDRVQRELTDADIARVAGSYHAWRGDKDAGDYSDVPGFCKAATLEDIRKQGHVLTPGRYVGAAAAEEDDEPFEEKMTRLAATLRQQQEEGARLDVAIAANLRELGYGG